MSPTVLAVLQHLILKLMWSDYRLDDRTTFERHDQWLSGFRAKDILSALNRLEREGFIEGDRLGDDAGFQLAAAGRIMACALGVTERSSNSAPPGYI